MPLRLGARYASLIARDSSSAGSVALLIKRRNFSGLAHYPSNRTHLACQRIKLAGKRKSIDAIGYELPLADHVHELDAGEHVVSGAERFEVEHRLGHPLNGAMVLFDDVVEVLVLDLAHHDRHGAAGVDRINGGLVG